eukprot:CAMPEP_0206044802 /NCGR_PEP_ID=MMETSP1466-20131121/13999_1 /ASSEMBLY_ACC=CAM_ASM_001126 /TAXON_ID=44452 /ORGANISM="Pavlova gyrans, Strain CCMP608" /LENGTH=116 /DNA_ID=CAMNT_0053419715 /DNA_START=11 /DNA_END=358 /DNA_ORIENTATION=-
MMYGFGGDPEPEDATLDCLEGLVVEFVGDLAKRATAAARQRAKPKVSEYLYAVRNRPRQWARARELLLLKKEIEAAKKASRVSEAGAEEDLDEYERAADAEDNILLGGGGDGEDEL